MTATTSLTSIDDLFTIVETVLCEYEKCDVLTEAAGNSAEAKKNDAKKANLIKIAKDKVNEMITRLRAIISTILNKMKLRFVGKPGVLTRDIKIHDFSINDYSADLKNRVLLLINATKGSPEVLERFNDLSAVIDRAKSKNKYIIFKKGKKISSERVVNLFENYSSVLSWCQGFYEKNKNEDIDVYQIRGIEILIQFLSMAVADLKLIHGNLEVENKENKNTDDNDNPKTTQESAMDLYDEIDALYTIIENALDQYEVYDVLTEAAEDPAEAKKNDEKKRKFLETAKKAFDKIIQKAKELIQKAITRIQFIVTGKATGILSKSVYVNKYSLDTTAIDKIMSYLHDMSKSKTIVDLNNKRNDLIKYINALQDDNYLIRYNAGKRINVEQFKRVLERAQDAYNLCEQIINKINIFKSGEDILFTATSKASAYIHVCIIRNIDELLTKANAKPEESDNETKTTQEAVTMDLYDEIDALHTIIENALDQCKIYDVLTEAAEDSVEAKKNDEKKRKFLKIAGDKIVGLLQKIIRLINKIINKIKMRFSGKEYAILAEDFALNDYEVNDRSRDLKRYLDDIINATDDKEVSDAINDYYTYIEKITGPSKSIIKYKKGQKVHIGRVVKNLESYSKLLASLKVNFEKTAIDPSKISVISSAISFIERIVTRLEIFTDKCEKSDNDTTATVVHEAIDALYETAAMVESAEYADACIMKAEELQKAVEDIPEERPIEDRTYPYSVSGGEGIMPTVRELDGIFNNDRQATRIATSSDGGRIINESISDFDLNF